MYVPFVSLFLLVASMAAGIPTPAARAQAPDSAARAAELIRAARAALGGEEKLGGVRGVLMRGAVRRSVEGESVDGQLEVALLLPDRFRRDETMKLMGRGDGPTMILGWDGTREWRDVKADALGGPVRIIRTPESDGAPQGRPGMPEAKAELLRIALATLLQAPESIPVSFGYVGPAETDAGRAEVVEATGPDGFAARLFLDAETHLPMAISFRAVERPKRAMRRIQASSPEEAERKLKESAAETPTPREVDVNLLVSEYRKVDGVLVPHRFERIEDGTLVEEWTVEEIELNPTLEFAHFSKK